MQRTMNLRPSPSLNTIAVELRMLIFANLDPRELVALGQVGIAGLD
jgi:hypothetical protein